jgi:hypothetical protein
MGQDLEAIARYVAGKKALDDLLESRSKTLETLNQFNFVKLWEEMKNPSAVAVFDIEGLENTLNQLARLEEQIRSLVKAINLIAEKSNSPKIVYKIIDPKLL